MKVLKSPITVAVLLACLTGVSLAGCGTKTEISKQEMANIRGGPVPSGYTAEAAKRKAAAEQRMPASFKNWSEQRSAALASHGAAPANSTAPQ